MRLMKRVARTVSLRLSEAKRFTSLGMEGNPTGSFGAARSFRWTFKNVFSGIPRAADASAGTAFALVGNEMVDPLAKMKVTFSFNFQDLLAARNYDAYGTAVGWVLLVAATDQYDPAPGGGFRQYFTQAASDDPGWFINQDPYRVTLNGNNCKLIKRWRVQHQPEILAPIALTSTGQTIITTSFAGAGNILKTITCKHRFKGKKTFEDYNVANASGNYLRSTFLRGWNYYWLIGWSHPANVIADQSPYIVTDQYTYFKDP